MDHLCLISSLEINLEIEMQTRMPFLLSLMTSVGALFSVVPCYLEQKLLMKRARLDGVFRSENRLATASVGGIIISCGIANRLCLSYD